MRRTIQRSICISVFVLGGMVNVVSARADVLVDTWPQWRGPDRDARVPGDDWADDLSAVEVLWQVPMGPSYSGPIVSAERVFVTETVDKEREVVRAIDRASGETLWQHAWDGAMKVPFFAASAGSWIRATPTYDGERLYVGGMREVLVALDAATGAEQWRIDFPAQFDTKMGDFGFVCSPLVDGPHLYVEAAQSVFKLEAATGKVVWRSETFPGGMMSSGSFSSPVLATLAGRTQLLVQTRESLKGIDPETGVIWWSQDVPSFRGMNILTPTIYGDAVLTSTYRNATYLFEIRASEETGGLAVEERWQNKAKAYMSSPVIIGDHAYVHQGNGRLTSIDLRDGTTAWTSEPMGEYWSMAVQGQRVLALNSEGTLLLFDATPEGFRLLDQRDLDTTSETWGYVAIAGETVFVRSLDALIALRWPAAGNAPTSGPDDPASAAR